MNKVKLRRLKKKLEKLRTRPANIKPEELINLAEALGRERSNRGKEPTYISALLPYRTPLSIPNHPGSLNKFTAGSILDTLEQDIFDLEEMLEKQG